MIYRIQHKKSKYGVYSHFTFCSKERPILFSEMLERHDIDKICHPTSSEDKGIERKCGENERFGFSNILQLSCWFNKFERRLLKHWGFHTVIIDKNPIVTGNYQVLFEE